VCHIEVKFSLHSDMAQLTVVHPDVSLLSIQAALVKQIKNTTDILQALVQLGMYPILRVDGRKNGGQEDSWKTKNCCDR